MEPLIDAWRAFIIRQKGDRHLLWGQRRYAASTLAADCPTPYASVIVREDQGKEVPIEVSYGFRPARLPERPDVRLNLVVLKGVGAEPLILLTSLPLKRRHEEVAWLVMAYFTRWRVEEAIRFMKQSYTLEDIRVLSYRRLRNLVTLVNAAAFFTAVVLGTRLKLDILASHLLKAAKRIFGVPDFRLYALADGIREICARHPRRSSAPPASDHGQLSLDFG